MLGTVTVVLEWLGIIVFAMTGALVASRKQMDVIGFVVLGTVTGIGGGTLRDLFLGLTPVLWVREPVYLIVCAGVSVLVFFTAHLPPSRYKALLWLDAVGLALFAVIGADIAYQAGVGPVAAVAMGVVSATFGGIIRDVLGGESPVILSREIYASAALLGALAYILLLWWAVPKDTALIAGFILGLGVRGVALFWDLSLPRYRPRPPAE